MWPCCAINDSRNGRYFEPILNFLRTGQIIYESSLNVNGILEEAKFFGVQEMIDRLQPVADSSGSLSGDNSPLTRQDVIRALTQTSYKNELRFQVTIVKHFTLGLEITELCIHRVST